MKRILAVVLMFSGGLLMISCGDSASVTPKNTTAAPTNTATVPAPANPAATEADVKKLIGDLAAALSKNDTAALEKLYADDYTLVTQTGETATKAERIGAIKSGDLKFESVAFSEIKVRGYGDTAVAIANSSGKSTNKGKTTETAFRITFVANKSKDGWRLVSAHLAPMPEAAKTDDAGKDDKKDEMKKDDAKPEDAKTDSDKK